MSRPATGSSSTAQAGGAGTMGIQIAKALGVPMCIRGMPCSTAKVALCKELGADEGHRLQDEQRDGEAQGRGPSAEPGGWITWARPRPISTKHLRRTSCRTERTSRSGQVHRPEEPRA